MNKHGNLKNNTHEHNHCSHSNPAPSTHVRQQHPHLSMHRSICVGSWPFQFSQFQTRRGATKKYPFVRYQSFVANMGTVIHPSRQIFRSVLDLKNVRFLRRQLHGRLFFQEKKNIFTFGRRVQLVDDSFTGHTFIVQQRTNE